MVILVKIVKIGQLQMGVESREPMMLPVFFVKERLFLKRMQLRFLAPLIRPINLNIFIFYETRTQYNVTGKNQKNRTLLRVFTTRSKRGSFER